MNSLNIAVFGIITQYQNLEKLKYKLLGNGQKTLIKQTHRTYIKIQRPIARRKEDERRRNLLGRKLRCVGKNEIEGDLGGDWRRSGRAREHEEGWSLGRVHVGGSLVPRLHESRVAGSGRRNFRTQPSSTQCGGQWVRLSPETWSSS